VIQTTAVIVGAGHAGLAMSRRLTDRSIDHVVLERGEVANSWRTQRWPTLRLLTPNWQTRLPGHPYAGDDSDGFMSAADVVATLAGYARLAGAPVRTATTVHTVRAVPQGFQIRAGDDLLHARAVVLATGACTLPAIPGAAAAVPPSVRRSVPISRPVLPQRAGRDPANTLAGTLVSPRDQARAPGSSSRLPRCCRPWPASHSLTGRDRPALIGQGPLQLPAGADAQLGEYLAQVPFDGTGADDKLSTDLRIR
jgi:glycine/D-amino acid oxidase-like deaminating enzyme